MAEVTAFLVEAATRRSPASPVYERGPLRWVRTRVGADPELGHEIVWYGDVPVWALAFHGGILREFVEMRPSVHALLCQALAQPNAQCPVRGPGRLVAGELMYVNSLTGDARHFAGRDAMYWRDRLVCFFDYVGGLLGGRPGSGAEIVTH